MSGAAIAPRLLAWAARHRRRDLPWQRDPTPYRVWVSEIMLQQTRVETVRPYYERFMARFPALRDLARAELDEVLHLWSGLGYYARARHLHRAARLVCERHGGRLPEDLAALQALPGIGRSTAAAILALSRGRRHAILDGNARRVLCRYHGIEGWPGEARVERELWRLAERHTPARRVRRYTQAIMDLGATVCTRGRPGCARCPLASDCRAHRAGRERELPAPRPRRALPERATVFLIARDPAGRVLLERRPPSGVWGGLLCPPECPPGEAPEAWCRRRLGRAPRRVRRLGPLRHGFTHFHLDITPVLLELDGAAAASVLDEGGCVWYDSASPQRYGLPAPVAGILARLAEATEEAATWPEPSTA